MRAYGAFIKKEWIELVRSYKLYILLTVFFIFGMLSVFTAKFMPQLMDALLPEGMVLNLPDPTALDAWAQFFKNISQLGFFILVIIFSGSMSNEITRGTLIPLLTKGLSRTTVVLAKFSVLTFVWSICYVVCFIVCQLYTVYFFSQTPPNLMFSAVCLWMFGVLLVALVLVGGILFRSSYGSLLFTGGAVVIAFIANMFPRFQKYNPVALINNTNQLLNDQRNATDFVWPIILCIVCIVGLLTLGIGVFRKAKL